MSIQSWPVWAMFALCASAGFVCAEAKAQCELQRLVGSNALPLSQSSAVVTMDGDFAAVLGDGMPIPGGVERMVYVYRRDANGTWLEHRQIVRPDATNNAGFGESMMLRGDRLVIGAPFDGQAGNNVGAAYVFDRDAGGTDNWGFVRKVLPIGAAPNDNIGTSVAIHGDVLVAGAPRSDDAGSNSGSAYIFVRNEGGADNWGQVARRVAPDAGSDHYFGDAVAVSGNLVAVGATYATGATTQAGAVYVFAKDHGGVNQWGQAAKMIASDGHPGDKFGRAISMWNNDLAVGAHDAETQFNNWGAAYLFEGDPLDPTSWMFKQKITGSDLEDAPEFGISVEIRGDQLIVGNDTDNQNAQDGGAAYLFTRDASGDWSQSHKLVSSSLAPIAYFGRSVAISDDTVIVGAPYDHAPAPQSGAAWVFSLDQSDCNANGICDARDIATGLSSDVNRNGILDECETYCQGLVLVPKQTTENAVAGRCIDFDGQTLIVGAPFDGFPSAQTGSAWVARRNPATAMVWETPIKLPTPPIEEFSRFGQDVAVFGGVAVVGTPYATVVVDIALGSQTYFEAGRAFVYERQREGTWELIQSLTAPSPTNWAYFGSALSLDEDLLVVGEPDRGRVHMFARDEGGADAWGFVRTLSPLPFAEGFGRAVHLRGDLLVVGAPLENVPTNDEGAVYIYSRNSGGLDNWGLVKRVIAPAPAPADRLGSAVAIEGDLMIAGAFGVDGSSADEGAAYVFERDFGGADSWGLRTTLTADAFARLNDIFGTSVAIEGSRVLVGVPSNFSPMFNPGAVFVFDRDHGGPDAWGRSARLVAHQPEVDQRFGSSVAVRDGLVVVGMELFPGVQPMRGGVLAMSLRDADCNLNGTCDSVDVYAEISPDINANGIPDECEAPACPADTNGDGTVNVADLLAVISAWGPCVDCPTDVNGDDVVNVADLLAVIAQWGACP